MQTREAVVERMNTDATNELLTCCVGPHQYDILRSKKQLYALLP